MSQLAYVTHHCCVIVRVTSSCDEEVGVLGGDKKGSEGEMREEAGGVNEAEIQRERDGGKTGFNEYKD